MCNCCDNTESPVKRIEVSIPPGDFWRSDVGVNLPDQNNDHTEAISHNGQVVIGGITPTANKALTVYGDADIYGQIDPNSIVFSDAPVGTVTAWDSAANNFYKVGVIGTQRPLVLMPITDAINAVQIRKADGSTIVFDADTLNRFVGINTATPKAALDVSGAVIHRQIDLPNFAANAPLGTAAATVDNASVISVTQTTNGITATIPAPTLTQAGRLLLVENIGTVSLTVDTTPIASGKMSAFVWSGTAWIPLAASGSGSSDDFWRSGAAASLALPDGSNDFTETISHNASVGVGLGDPSTVTARLDVNGAQVLRPVNITNKTANGSLGTAAATVDAASTLVLAQTTANIALTLPNPTNAQPGRLLYVTHDGAATGTTVGGKPISPGETLLFIWDGNSWNGNAAPISADFWRSGATAATLPDNTSDVIDGIVHNGKVGIGDTTAFTNATTLAAALDVSGASVLRPVALGKFTANGAIGTAAATVDIASTISINQTTGNISLTIPNPTNTQQGRVLNIANIGTAQIKVGGQYITPKTGQSYVFTGGQWIPLGDNPDVIVVGASRNLAPTDHLKTLLVTADVTLTCPANIGYLLFRMRQQTAGGVGTIAGAAGVTVTAPYGASNVGIAGSSLVIECYNNVVWVE